MEFAVALITDDEQVRIFLVTQPLIGEVVDLKPLPPPTLLTAPTPRDDGVFGKLPPMRGAEVGFVTHLRHFPESMRIVKQTIAMIIIMLVSDMSDIILFHFLSSLETVRMTAIGKYKMPPMSNSRNPNKMIGEVTIKITT